MKKTILTYGLLTGLLMSAALTFIPQACENPNGFGTMEIVGFSSMILSGVLVFMGVRSFRKNHNGGVLTFGKGFTVGILTVLVASVIYVIAWEIIYFNFAPDFGDKYAAHEIAKLQESGATPEAITEKTQAMEKFTTMYQNPFFNAAITFIEPLPVGLLISLICGIALRKK